MLAALSGFAAALAVMAASLALFVGVAALALEDHWSVPYPSASLLRGLAQAGIGLLIAYSVAMAAAEQALSKKSTRPRQEWMLGFAAGGGLSGLLGVGIAFALAEHRAAGHANFLDILGFSWVLVAIGQLGLMVALFPLFSYAVRTPDREL